MRTVILDSASSGLDELLERRRRAGLDRLDEVWQGELHMIPAPSFEHAEIATRLARLLGPTADQAGLTIAMHWLTRTADGYRPLARSGLIDMGADDLRGRLRWPSADADADEMSRQLSVARALRRSAIS